MDKFSNESFGTQLPKIITNIPGPESCKFAKLSNQFEPIAITRISEEKIPIFWKKAYGANVIDIDNNIYIDCSSAFGVSSIGHNNEYVKSSLKKQISKLIHCMGDICPSEKRVLLSEKLVEMINRKNFSQVLYANSGSECIEIALKVAYLYTKKPGIISFKGSFHGQSIGALNVTGQHEIRNPFKIFLMKNVYFVTFPNPYRQNISEMHMDSEKCLKMIIKTIEEKRNSSSEIGALIIEPIQNCNGFIIPPNEFLDKLSDLCKKYSILLIVDEIFTGLGRTGRFLAIDYTNVNPDIICIGKILGGGMPIAACLSSAEIFNSFSSNTFLPLHGSTFSGNPLACASALSVLSIIKNTDILQEINKKGKYFLNKLKNLKEKYFYIGDVRGKGLLLAIELVKDRNTKEPFPELSQNILNESLKRGLIAISSGIPYGNIITFTPPFCISFTQINEVIKILDDSFQKIISS